MPTQVFLQPEQSHPPFVLPAYADVAEAPTTADIHVGEAEDVGQQLADAAEVDEQEGDTQEAVEHADKATPLSCWSYVTVALNETVVIRK